jgi:hypothetical protein
MLFPVQQEELHDRLAAIIILRTETAALASIARLGRKQTDPSIVSFGRRKGL